MPRKKRKDERVHIRIEPADRATWMRLAAESDRSLSAWVRFVLNKAIKK